MAKAPIPPRFIALILFVADLIGLLIFFNFIYWLRLGKWLVGISWSISWPILLTLLSLYVVDVYRTDTQVSGMRAPVRAFVGVLFAGLLTSVVAYVGGYWGDLFGRGVLPVSLLFFAIWASTARFFISRWVRRRTEHIRWLILGAGEPAAIFWKDFKYSKSEGELIILAKDEKEKQEALSKDLPSIRGTLNDLDTWDNKNISGIIITLSPSHSDELIQKLMHKRSSGIRVYDLADFYEHTWLKVPVLHLRNGWFVFAHGFDLIQNPLGMRMKRVIDAILSVALFVLFMPIMLIVAIIIKLDSQGPSIYKQERVGEGGENFTVYKFRSMYIDAEQQGALWASHNDPRITRVGRFIRMTRIDEWPQLLNVIKGDMSFVGPRPERPEFSEMLEREIPYYDLRYLVKPGITGWAQVMYPYGSSIEDAREKLQYDLYYIKNYSLLLDIAIFFKTLRVILLGKGR